MIGIISLILQLIFFAPGFSTVPACVAMCCQLLQRSWYEYDTTRELIIPFPSCKTPGDWKREVCHWMACTWAMTLNLADSFLTSRGEHHDCQEERDFTVCRGIVAIVEPYGGYTYYTETSPSFSCVFSAKGCRRYCLVAVAIVIRSYQKWVGWKVEGQELEIGTIPRMVEELLVMAPKTGPE